MQNLQIIKPHVLREFMIVNEPLLKSAVREEQREERRGRPRIAELWVLVAIVVVARMESITWRALPEKLEGCKFLIEEGWMRSIPSKSTFHAVWKNIEPETMEQWITMIGTTITLREKSNTLVVDSSGVKSKTQTDTLVCGDL